MPDKIKELKMQIAVAAHMAKEGHIASAYSILDILWVVYNKTLKKEDKFILSKGHGCLALYAVLPGNLLQHSFGKYDSILGGHPDRNKVPGVEASTGSLGHGLPMACGEALAFKIQKKEGRIFCLIGDGEANEGSIWETCLLASKFKLDNLRVVVDYNHSTDRAVDLNSLTDKFRSFGFFVHNINGHKHNEIEYALSINSSGCPTAIIAQTVKGKGCARMESSPSWHHRSPNDQELKEILEELCVDN